jgi:large subunit ribosomal protein L24
MSKNRIAPQDKFHVKKNDEVVVLSGSHRGKRGKVLEVIRTKNRVLIEGVNMIKKAMRKTQDNPQGGIVEREGTVHISNVMLAAAYDARRGTAAPAKAKK